MAGKGRDIEAASAYVRLYMKGAEWAKGLKQAGAQLDAFANRINAVGKSISVAAAALGAPLVLSVKAFADIGSEFKDASDRSGVFIRDLSELAFAAEQSGAELNDLEKAMRKGGITSAKQFEQVAETVARMGDPAKQIEFVMSKLGRSGAALLPLLKTGAKGIKEMRAEAVRLGLAFSQHAVDKAEALGDKLGVLFSLVKRVMFAVGQALEPVITPLVEGLASVLVDLRKLIDANPKAVQQFAAAVVALVASGGALIALAMALKVIAGAMIGLGVIGVALTGGIGGGGAAAGVGALAGVLGVATAKLVTFTDLFKALKDTVSDAFKGVAGAVKAGDLLQAFEIIKLGAQTIWLELMVAMKEAFASFVDFFMSKWDMIRKSVIDMGFALKEMLPPILGGGKSPQTDKERAAAFAKIDQETAGRPGADRGVIDALRKELEQKILEFSAAVTKGIYSPAQAAKLRTNRFIGGDVPEFEGLENRNNLSVSGTFSGFAARGLTGDLGSVQSRIAAATEATAKNTQKIKIVNFH